MTRCFRSAFVACSLLSVSAICASPVSVHGWLSVREGALVGEFTGQKVRLAGMTLGDLGTEDESLVWGPQAMGWLGTDWGSSVVRLRMDVSRLPALEAYRNNPNLAKARIHQWIQGAIERGLYVVVSWHEDSLSDHPAEAKDFFEEMAMVYAGKPNLLFEPYEGLSGNDYDWSRLRKLHQEILSVIRAHHPGVVIVSTPRDSRESDAALANPLGDTNVVYAQKLDPGSDETKDRLRLGKLVEAKLPVFVNQLSAVRPKDGKADLEMAGRWKAVLDTLGLPWCGWSLSRATGGGDALVPSASPDGGWTASDLTPMGSFFRTAILGDGRVKARFDTFSLPGVVEARAFGSVGFDHVVSGKPGERPHLELFGGSWSQYQVRAASAFRARVILRGWAGSAGTILLKRGSETLSQISVAASSGASMGTFATPDSIDIPAGPQDLRIEWSTSDTGRLVLDQFETDPGETRVGKNAVHSRWRVQSTIGGLEMHGASSQEPITVRVSNLQGRLLAQGVVADPVAFLRLEEKGVVVVHATGAQGKATWTLLR
ncbi:MAG TPA: cellulase family glycosylhydrolase [Fibrobacteria bacterium]|nr:cellulase family glycosylhydrolase [Fibrobacteria bacterium]